MNEQLISRLDFFSELASNDRVWLQNLDLRTRKFTAKSDNIHRYQSYDCAYFLSEGWALRYNKIKDDRQITNILVGGDFFDVNVSRSYQGDDGFVVLENAALVRIPRALVLEMMTRPSIANALLSVNLIEADTLRVWLTNLGKRDAMSRVAHLICEWQTRLTINTADKVMAFQCPLTQTHFGDALGLTSVHVNRMLRNLREAGLVEVSQGKVLIKDHGGLREMAKFDPSYLYPAGRGQTP